ncbi:hypothetical protein [Leifsonia virtsii]|uniref:NTF2-like N-terminal transpeptidase domain-containing protein n=1 Tax=Leifsonia virtsii TaxID=3035915 RepID=A0ABT8IX19_9MICO|nr:hypothetical protein [Leifsonia virtsii]MDN4597355.1 hypothetical protein [Leifsonia virtsii]
MSIGSEGAPVRRMRVRWYWWVLGFAAVLSTAAGAFFSASTVAAAQNMPRTVVARYLDALVHGNAREAMALGGIHAGKGDVLLDQKAYATATDRIASYTLSSPVTRKGVTTVVATVQQGDRPYQRSFRVVRAGGLPFLPLWKLAPVTPDTVEVEADGPSGLVFTVGGKTPKVEDRIAKLRALPGSYPVEFARASGDYSVKSGVAVSHGVGSVITPTVFAAEISDSGAAAAKAAVESWLDTCLATQESAPANCPFYVQAPVTPGVQMSDIHWSLVTRPEVDVLYGAWYDGGWDVQGRNGSVTATATLTRTSDGASAQVTTEEIPFQYSGTVTFTGDGAVFTPLFDDGSAQG